METPREITLLLHNEANQEQLTAPVRLKKILVLILKKIAYSNTLTSFTINNFRIVYSEGLMSLPPQNFVRKIMTNDSIVITEK
jgi:hypothetical protein